MFIVYLYVPILQTSTDHIVNPHRDEGSSDGGIMQLKLRLPSALHSAIAFDGSGLFSTRQLESLRTLTLPWH